MSCSDSFSQLVVEEASFQLLLLEDWRLHPDIMEVGRCCEDYEFKIVQLEVRRCGGKVVGDEGSYVPQDSVAVRRRVVGVVEQDGFIEYSLSLCPDVLERPKLGFLDVTL